MKLIITFILALFVVSCTEFVVFSDAYAGDSVISVEQIGSGNTVSIDQDGTGHSTSVNLGTISDVDYTTLTILQQGTTKTASVEIQSGINNSIEINQRGLGYHTSNIISFNGSGNDIKVNQNGSGSHDFTLTGTGTNNANLVNVLQEGNANKSFSLNMNGTNGATVDVQQTNPTQANQGSMSIQCNPCGAYSYSRQ